MCRCMTMAELLHGGVLGRHNIRSLMLMHFQAPKLVITTLSCEMQNVSLPFNFILSITAQLYAAKIQIDLPGPRSSVERRGR